MKWKVHVVQGLILITCGSYRDMLRWITLLRHEILAQPLAHWIRFIVSVVTLMFHINRLTLTWHGQYGDLTKCHSEFHLQWLLCIQISVAYLSNKITVTSLMWSTTQWYIYLFGFFSDKLLIVLYSGHLGLQRHLI